MLVGIHTSDMGHDMYRLFHVIVYPDGRVCISILHPPGEDRFSDETADEVCYIFTFMCQGTLTPRTTY